MTNAEKFKTPQDRAEAFDRFCKINTTVGGMCMPDCKLFYAQDDSKDHCGHCEFHWLDLEAEEEKPLPCPFCASELDVSKAANTKSYGIHCGCGYYAPWKRTKHEAIAAHNRVAKAVLDEKEKEGGAK